MSIDLYTMNMSSPCRSVQLVGRALGLNLNKINRDLFTGEHMTPEFLALNPQHTVPTIKDGDFALWESRAICTYLVNQYGKDESVYPKCPKKKAMVDRMLYFDTTTLYDRFGKWFYPVMSGTVKTADPANLEKLHEALAWLDGFLDGHKCCVGDDVTVADYVLVASVSTFEAAGVCLKKHKNVSDWLQRCKDTMPGYEEENGIGVKAFGEMAKQKLGTA